MMTAVTIKSHISNEKCNNNIEKPKLATALESTAEKGCYRERKQSIKNYCIRYENNGSKRWDGKEVLVDKELLEELRIYRYSPWNANSAALDWKERENHIMEYCCCR